VERQRVVPVVREVCRQTKVPVSVDTAKMAVARAALDNGARIINDVTGFQGDPHMIPLAVESGAGLCVMHMQGTPQTMQDRPTYDDVVHDIFTYLTERRDCLLNLGVDPRCICVDPGIGFGKTHEHNLQLLSHCHEFLALECPLLVGHSRKAFIGAVLGDKQADRTAGTIGVALALAAQGVHVLRVHDVKLVKQALTLFAVTGGMESPIRNTISGT
jgi:dihydropteroate synthase